MRNSSERFDLNGEWKLGFCENSRIPHDSENLKSFEGISKFLGNIIDTRVPRNLELALMESGLIDYDPFFGDNIYRLREYESYHSFWIKHFDFEEIGYTGFFLVLKALIPILTFIKRRAFGLYR